MKSEYINPFVKGTVETFEIMCDAHPVRDGDLRIRIGMQNTYDLVGIIGLSGVVRGAVLLSMPPSTALPVISRFLGETITEADHDFFDAYGEILNIIAGSSTAKLGSDINLALPSVIMGEHQVINSLERSPWLQIPMAFPTWGKFTIEISVEGKQ